MSTKCKKNLFCKDQKISTNIIFLIIKCIHLVLAQWEAMEILHLIW
jgi:hypothetical protein